MKITVHIEKDETGYYTAEVPALPGCLTQGRTLAEVSQNVKEAISAWFAVMENKAHCRHDRDSRTIAISV